MNLFNIFDTTGHALNTQNIRLNIIASNIGNANTVASSPDEAYKALNPIFSQAIDQATGLTDGSVAVQSIETSDRPHPMLYQPDNPMADENGYIYQSNVNSIEEMANMIAASRSYQTNVEVVNTSKTLMLETIRMGR